MLNYYRSNCIKQLNNLSPQHETYFVELENRLFELVGKFKHENQIHEYHRKYVQLFYNLKKQKNYLIQNFTPSELVFLDSNTLNPQFKKEMENNHVQNMRYKDIQNLKLEKIVSDHQDDTPMSSDDDDDEKGTIQCSKCKQSKNITIVPRQLRSADEPMSMFITCNICNHHWKIN